MTINNTISVLAAFLLIIFQLVEYNQAAYAASDDNFIYTIFRDRAQKPVDHAKVARQLVHDTDWAAVGSISTDDKIKGFPMVNVISTSDSAVGAPSTGKLYFLLTDLDFTGQDWRKQNKVVFMFNSEQRGRCSDIDVDPFEPTCQKTYISGKVVELQKGPEYDFGWNAFVSRHPATSRWIKAHNFYLCMLVIDHIYVLDWYGGPNEVSVEDYYRVQLD